MTMEMTLPICDVRLRLTLIFALGHPLSYHIRILIDCPIRSSLPYAQNFVLISIDTEGTTVEFNMFAFGRHSCKYPYKLDKK